MLIPQSKFLLFARLVLWVKFCFPHLDLYLKCSSRKIEPCNKKNFSSSKCHGI